MRPPYECSEALCGYRPAWRFLTAFYKEVSIMNETKQLNHDYLTIADIKNYLNISQAAAYELSHRTDFPVCRFGGCIRIPRDAFLAWVDQRTTIPKDIRLQMRTA